MQVKKRDGSFESFSENKIQRALLLAFNACGMHIDVSPILHTITHHVIDFNGLLTVDVIQDIIENCLMESGFNQVAKSYILYRVERNRARAVRMKPDPNIIADYIHAAKYARYLRPAGRRETYHETVDRVTNMHIKRWPQHERLILESFEYVHEKRVLSSMRSMQFAGPAIEHDNARMYNCSGTHVNRIAVFDQIFYLLLMGCGVGYSVQWHHVEQLSTVKHIGRCVSHFHVPDSAIGWASAIKHLMICYFNTGLYPEFDYSSIRAEGSPLVTSGGMAPGHLGLKICIEKVRGVLDSAANRQLRPIECHDIICYLAECVLCGGIRRSSLIALFSLSDTEMMYAKSPGIFEKNPQRAMANNSAVLLRDSTDISVFDRLLRIADEGYGEPGFFFTHDKEFVCNPCGEIGMYPVFDGLSGFSFCNLVEINMALDDDLTEAAAAASTIATLQAAYTDFPYLGKTTENICRRDALLGVSLTGLMDKPDRNFNESLLKRMKCTVIDKNKQVAALIGINAAVRATCVKPSGTASLELGCIGSGIHPHHARRYFRRVTANANEIPLKEFMRVNPHAVERKPNGDFCIVFPVQAPDNAIVKEQISDIKFVNKVLFIHKHWITPGHNISCTVIVNNRKALMQYIWENRDAIAGMSFVSEAIEQRFDFMPLEVCRDEDKWNKLQLTNIDWSKVKEDKEDLRIDSACEGGACILPRL